MNINIFKLPIQVLRIYAFEFELCDVAGKLKRPATEITIELTAVQYLQGPR
jgi:hypothetical protein